MKNFFVKIKNIIIITIINLVLLELALNLLSHYITPRHIITDDSKAIKHSDNTKTVIAIGDSYTWGGEVAPTETYPAKLQNIFLKNGQNNVNVINAGLCESNSTIILNRLNEFIGAYHPDYVVLLIGSANRYNLKGYSPSKFPFINFITNLKSVNMLKIMATNLRGLILSSKANSYNNVKHMRPFFRNSNYKKDVSLPRSLDQLDKEEENNIFSVNPKWLDSKGTYQYHIARGNQLFNDHNYEAAEEEYSKALKTTPKFFVQYKLLGDYYLNNSEFEKAEKIFLKILNLVPSELNTILSYANLLTRKQRYLDAEELLKFSIKNDPNNTLLHLHLGSLYVNLGKVYEAEMIMLNNMGSDPDLEKLFYLPLSGVYLSQRKFSKAEFYNKKAIETFEDNDDAYISLGRIYVAQAKYKKAKDSFNHILTRNANNEDALFELAECHLLERNFSESFSIYKNILKLNPASVKAYIGLGNYYRLQHQFIEAETAYKKAIELNTDIQDPEPEGYYAYLAITQGKYNIAFEYFSKAVEKAPWIEELYYFLARSFELQSQYDSKYFVDLYNRILLKSPGIKKNETISNYIKYFSNRSEWEERLNDWLRADLDKIVEICKTNNIQLIIQNYPYPYNSANKILEETANKYSLPFIDNYSVFKELVKKDGWNHYFTDFDHCTEEGLLIMANNVYKSLISMFEKPSL